MSKNQSGFTLVETLVAMIITGLIIGVIMTFSMNSLVTFTVSNSRATLLDSAQLGLETVNEDIRQSAAADDNNRIPDSNGPGAPGNLFGWQSDADTLILAEAAEDSANNILFEDASEYISYKNNVIYFLDGTTLKKRTLAASVANNSAKTSCPPATASSSCPADRTIMENVSSIVFRYYNSESQEVAPDSARSVEVTVTLNQVKYTKNVSVTYSTRTVFRND